MKIYSHVDGSFDLLADPMVNDEILLYEGEIDVSKNCCIEGFTSGICKDLLTLVPNYFVSIFQASLLTTTFPSFWSKGIVKVIPKSGDLSDPSNWRPICQTPLFAKIMEKLVYTRKDIII